MPKNKRPAPFWVFVIFYRDSQRREGRRLTNDEAKVEAEPIWASMSMDEKANFYAMAKDERVKQREQRFLSDARSPRKHTQSDELRSDAIQQVIDLAKSKKGLESSPFFLLSVQLQLQRPEARPCELSIVRLSLRHGVESYFHAFINCGKPEASFVDAAEKMTKRVHCIPAYGMEGAVTDLDELVKEIKKFCENEPLFATPNSFRDCVGAAKFLNKRVDNERITVLDGELLFTKLCEAYNYCPLNFSAVAALKNPQFQYNHYLKCDYHQGVKTINCSLFSSLCSAYNICHVLSPVFNYKLQALNHFPHESKPEGIVLKKENDQSLSQSMNADAIDLAWLS